VGSRARRLGSRDPVAFLSLILLQQAHHHDQVRACAPCCKSLPANRGRRAFARVPRGLSCVRANAAPGSATTRSSEPDTCEVVHAHTAA
jgi:hypothetical protein